MADVGKKTDKKTQAGRDVYKTPEGEMVSEKSTTIEYKGKWINIPTIHGGKQYSENQLVEMLNKDLIEPTSVHNELEEAIEAAQSRSNSLEFNKGGTPMQEQMELFEDGGLKDEGGMVDEESGNDVPSGSTRKEVRDDIPAMISEGEFIFPADVVRYIGLDKLMRIRQDAKMGLKEMEAMGQMGNSDEATMPDDLPFGMADLIIVEEPEEKAHGGMAHKYNTGGIVWPTHPTIPVETVTYHNPETGEKIEVRTQQGVPIDSVPEGFVLFDATPVTPTTPVTQPIAPVAAQPNIGEEDDDTPPPVNKFVEAGGWNGAPLETYISEAEKVTGLTGSIMSGIAGVVGGPLMGIFVHLAQKANKNKILATIDERIEQAKKTTVSGQVAALRAMKDKLEGKTNNQSILGKIGDVLSNVVENISESLGLTTEQKEKVKKVAIAAESVAPVTTIGPKMRPTTLDETDQAVIDAVTDDGQIQLTPEEKDTALKASIDPANAEVAIAQVQEYGDIGRGSSMSMPLSPKKIDFRNFVQDEELRRKTMLDPITLPLEGAQTDANKPPSLIQPDMLPLRTSVALNKANEVIARNLASEQLNLTDKIKELVGINTLGDAPIAGTSKDPSAVFTATEPNVDTDSEGDTSLSDNYNTNAAEQRRKRILELTGKGSSTTVPVPTTTPTQTTKSSDDSTSSHTDMMRSAQAAAKAKRASQPLQQQIKQASAAVKKREEADSFDPRNMNKGGLNKKKRGLATRK